MHNSNLIDGALTQRIIRFSIAALRICMFLEIHLVQNVIKISILIVVKAIRRRSPWHNSVI